MVTVISRTIGGLGGEYYSTIASWESDAPANLVTSDQLWEGKITDTRNENVQTIAGSISDATRYKHLTADAGAEFDPAGSGGSGTGARIQSSGNATLLTMGEHYARLSKLGLINTYTGTSFKTCLKFGSAATCISLKIDSCVFVGPGGSNSSNLGMYFNGQRGFQVTNCIFVGDATTSSGLTGGIYGYGTTTPFKIYNCVAYNFNRIAFTTSSASYSNGYGFRITNAVSGSELKNCISTNNNAQDFNLHANVTKDYNCSEDSTAAGSNSITGQVATDLFTDPANNDFSLKAGSNAIDDGVDLSATFTTDFSGATHGSSGTWEMGAYAGYDFNVTISINSTISVLNYDATLVMGTLSVQDVTVLTMPLLVSDPSIDLSPINIGAGYSDIVLMTYDIVPGLGPVETKPASIDIPLLAQSAERTLGSINTKPSYADIPLLAQNQVVSLGQINTKPSSIDIPLLAQNADRTLGPINTKPSSIDVPLLSQDSSLDLGPITIDAGYIDIPLLAQEALIGFETYGVKVGGVTTISLQAQSSAFSLGEINISPSVADFSLVVSNHGIAKGAINITPGYGDIGFSVPNVDRDLGTINIGAGVDDIVILTYNALVEKGDINIKPGFHSTMSLEALEATINHLLTLNTDNIDVSMTVPNASLEFGALTVTGFDYSFYQLTPFDVQFVFGDPAEEEVEEVVSTNRSVSLGVTYIGPRTTGISWTHRLPFTAVGKTYTVQRSECSQGEFENISDPIQATNAEITFVDQDPPNKNLHSTFYYRLALRNSSGSLLYYSPVEYPRVARSTVAMEMIRRQNLLLKRFNGIRAFLYTRKSAGKRCPDCWDSVKERRNKSHCSTCGGTGFASGYSCSAPMLVAESSPMKVKSIDLIGAHENIAANYFTSNFPLVKPGDIFVADNRQFYRIESVHPVMFRDTLVMQQFNAYSIEKDREINNLVIPSFSEFDSIDLIHRQYGGMSLNTTATNADRTVDRGEFDIHEEGYTR